MKRVCCLKSDCGLNKPSWYLDDGRNSSNCKNNIYCVLSVDDTADTFLRYLYALSYLILPEIPRGRLCYHHFYR